MGKQESGECFYFVMNPLIVEAACPFEIIPGHYLQKPNGAQLQMIMPRLDGFCTAPHWPRSMHLGYNADWVPYGNGGRLERIAALSDWRYWIIKYVAAPPHQRGPDSEIGLLQASANLIADDLDIGFGFLHVPPPYGPCFMVRDNAPFTYLTQHAIKNEPLTLTRSQLDQISSTFQSIKEAKARYPATFRLVQQFGSLKTLPRQSEMQVLGCFSVLEGLFTHAPKMDEADSITHQIKTKMRLLSKRFDRQLDCESNFKKSATSDKIWSSLYSYRSKIVHGGSVDFKNDSNLRILGNEGAVLTFLKEAAKLSLLLALKEPEFIADLQAV